MTFPKISLYLIAFFILASSNCSKTSSQIVATPSNNDQVQTIQGKVLLIHSYHSDYEWVASITRGVRRALKRGVELEVFYMDTKRKTDRAWFKKVSIQGLEIIQSWQPDVVILADDNAQELIGRHLAGKDRPWIVFCGVNAEPQKYGYPAKNVTGILERPQLGETIKFIQKLHPGIKKVAMLSDDSPTTQATFTFFRTQKAPAQLIGWNTPTLFSDWKKDVQKFQTTADAIAIYTYHTLKNQSQHDSLPGKEIMAWTLQNSKIPIIGFLTFGIDDGMVCGVAESGVEHGLLAGQMALALLSGKSIEALPIQTAGHGMTMFNVNSARKFGIKVSDETLKSFDIIVE